MPQRQFAGEVHVTLDISRRGLIHEHKIQEPATVEVALVVAWRLGGPTRRIVAITEPFIGLSTNGLDSPCNSARHRSISQGLPGDH